MDLSIVVSTWNRAEDVQRFLDSLESTKVSGDRTWEVIVVDNRSTDGTADVVQAAIHNVNYRLRYVFEGRPGKSRGVNAGIRAAEGDIIAFTDDDAIVPANWVDGIIAQFEDRAEVVCIGGMVKPYAPDVAPVSVRLSTEPAVVQQENFAVTSIPIIGCNMAVRRHVLDEIGPFDTELGPGTPTKAAEDVDILYRIVREGHALHYVPEIALFHNHDRRTPERILLVTDGYLIGRGAFYVKFLLKGDVVVARWFYRELRSQIRRTIQGEWSYDSAGTRLRAIRILLAGGLRYIRYRSWRSERA